MSDNRRRYRTIKNALAQLYPTEPKGKVARHMGLMGEACYWYTKRSWIETFFSEQKSRGFNLHKSHISEPARLARLMIASCLAYTGRGSLYSRPSI